MLLLEKEIPGLTDDSDRHIFGAFQISSLWDYDQKRLGYAPLRDAMQLDQSPKEESHPERGVAEFGLENQEASGGVLV
jgi:hypothetical protein